MASYQHYPFSEFKAHLSSVMDEVEAGKTFIITRHGKQVAKVTPASPVFNPEEAEAAYRNMRALAESLPDQRPFDWEGEWKAYRDEGRP